MKALGRPGRCGLLRERSRLARLRPVDAIRRGALSGAQALWSSGSDSNGRRHAACWTKLAPGHGLGSPLRCQRVRVKIHAATCGSGGWPGPHYFLPWLLILSCPVFSALSAYPQRTLRLKSFLIFASYSPYTFFVVKTMWGQPPFRQAQGNLSAVRLGLPGIC